MTNGRGKSRSLLRLIMLASCAALLGFEAGAAPFISETRALRYSAQYGYLPPVDPRGEEIIQKAISTKISKFQSSTGIKVTGEIDVKTARLMSFPRHGVKDKIGLSASGRSERDILDEGPRWPRKNLTYKIVEYSRTLDRTFVDEEIARAFAVWSNYTDLTFSPKKKEVDIEISFVFGEHGHNDSFEEPAIRPVTHKLAHAYFPRSGNRREVHFDNYELWTVDSHEGYNLFQVAVHQFGHSLGLNYSQTDSAFATPSYRLYDPNFKLHENDIAGIQALYGPKTRNGSLDLCEDPRIDTIFNTTEGHIYVFKGKYCWRLKPQGGIVAGYPQLIAKIWKGLPSNIDAAFSYQEWTYFFKGSEYWAYFGRRKAGSNPRNISTDFQDIPHDINAATTKNGDEDIIFLKGTRFWRLRPNGRSKIFERPASKITENVDAAFAHDGKIYYFKGDSYYLDNGERHLTGPRWFGCPLENR